MTVSFLDRKCSDFRNRFVDIFANIIGMQKNPIAERIGQAAGQFRRTIEAAKVRTSAIIVPRVFVKLFTRSMILSISSVRI